MEEGFSFRGWTTPKLIAQYRYNGLGERIGWQYDTDADGTVETSSSSDDPWFYFLHDDRWRVVATITAIDDGAGTEAGEYLADADDDPKELFIYHAAGLSSGGGRGGSSYIDTLILRDADLNGNGGWGGASDGTLEHRSYYCQNWRADVVALLDDTGARREGARYFAYGMPFGMPRTDCDGDGDVDAADSTIISNASGKSAGQTGYDVRADVNLDGTVDATDSSLHSTDSGQSLGRGNLSRDPTLTNGVGNRIGYAGYLWDPVESKYHVRNRVKDPVSGRWLRRDPIGYVDGASLYEYAGTQPLVSTDPFGLRFMQVCLPSSPFPGRRVAGSVAGTQPNEYQPCQFNPGGSPVDVTLTPERRQECCDDACSAAHQPYGRVTICDGHVIGCACEDNFPDMPDDFRDQLAQCIQEHEDHNTRIVQIDPVTGELVPVPGATYCDVYCNEAEAYDKTLRCVKDIKCDFMDSLCEDLRDAYDCMFDCRHQHWQDLCDKCRNGDPYDIDQFRRDVQRDCVMGGQWGCALPSP